MQLIQSLLKKYWAGNATAEERDLLMNLLKEKSHENIEEYKHEINSFTEDTSVISTIPDAGEMLQRIHLKIQLQEEKGKKKTPVIRIPFNRFKWIAAAIILFFFSKYIIERQAAPANKLVSATETGVTEKVVIHTITNITQGVQQVQLRDSSVVKLYPQSSLSFSDSFNIVNRVITLHGKAFFKVVKNTGKPFSVQLGDIVTTALGTHFMVDGTGKTENIRVRLLEGKVVIHNVRKDNMKPVYLLPGQVCTIDLSELKAVVRQWKQPTVSLPVVKPGTTKMKQERRLALEFERTPLHDVFKTVEKIYNIKIDYTAAEEKKQVSFTGNFPTTISPELLITIICKTNDLTFEKRENVYFISNLK